MNISSLLKIASPSICECSNLSESTLFLSEWGAAGGELAAFYGERNGCFAFESSLLIRPIQSGGPVLGVIEWNSPQRWRNSFQVETEGALFFGEDVFGGQFCIRNGMVQSFDPETGLYAAIASTLSEWVKLLLSDYNYLTGYSLSHEWQIKNGPLSNGMRLLPKKPFVLGGAFEINNLYSMNDVKGMQFRSSIANEIRHLPDGSEVTIII